MFHIDLPRKPRHTKKRTFRNIGIASVILVFVALVIWLVVGASRVVSSIESGTEFVQRAGVHATQLNFQAAEADLVSAANEIERAQSGMVFFSWLKVVPVVGDQVTGVSLLFDAGFRTLSLLQDAARVADRMFAVVKREESEASVHTLTAAERLAVTRAFHTSTADLLKMRAKAQLVARDLEAIAHLSLIKPIDRALVPVREFAPDVFTMVNALAPLSAGIFDFTGYGEDRQWLILFLNNTEMRPAGGFIGTYGLLLMRDGEVKALEIDDAYQVDRRVETIPTYAEVPPLPISTYTPVSKWYFRDANWSPDFRISAADSARLFQEEHRAAGLPTPKIHAVVGFTPTFAEHILEVIGSVNVDGFTFTPENVTELLEYQVEVGYEELDIPKEDRKDIVGSLTKAVLAELKTADAYELFALFRVVARDIREKQIAFHSFDPSVSATYVDAGWSGAIEPKTADSLMVVDANMLALKTDRVMEEQIGYAVQPDGDGYLATVTLHYAHTAPKDTFTSRYRDYVRVYAPLGSELVAQKGMNDVTVSEELGMQVFGFFHVVEPETTSDLEISYRLPQAVSDAVARGVYQLTLFKQMGARNHALTLDLNFGKNVRAAEPAEDTSFFGDTKYQVETTLSQDMVVTVEL